MALMGLRRRATGHGPPRLPVSVGFDRRVGGSNSSWRCPTTVDEVQTLYSAGVEFGLVHGVHKIAMHNWMNITDFFHMFVFILSRKATNRV